MGKGLEDEGNNNVLNFTLNASFLAIVHKLI